MWTEEGVEHWNPTSENFLWLLSWFIGTLGNADILATFIRNRDTTDACLINLIAGNILAILCLPINYLHHFYLDFGLGFPMEDAFLMSRNIATGVQLFSMVVYSALKFSNVKSSDNYEAINILPDLIPTALSTRHERGRCVTATRQTSVIWGLAVLCSLLTAFTSEASDYIYVDDVFVDDNAKLRTIFHCVTFCIIPQILIVCLCVLTALRRRDVADKTEDDGELMFWLTCAILINYVPFNTWILCSWSQGRLLTVAAVDFLTYFPLYSTACWTPPVVYFFKKAPKKQLAAV
ncbi:uncharacterized protein LOC110834606 [Zootermopsis nevadensis]|uniref:G-protein coupled receptors family 1 profile domain-containing protein n=1 Tax=Zootermopsis nevadensis TaxID=136037 RepID=A0A067QVR2_ZOONE|nr:uncharacterized protein LOC110834606 [Zootermopsis nevadensis]KDR14298.1 hypothetical protein L798_11889 [Zootermopsis nevadensis]